MELSVHERIVLLDMLLAYRGNFLALKIVRQLREELSFSEEDFKTFNLQQVNGQVSWDEKTVTDKFVEMGEQATAIVVEALTKLDQAGQLSDREFSLATKFLQT